MCGIVGIYKKDRFINNIFLKKSTDTLRHRGPDDEGYVLFDTKKKNHKLFSGNDSISIIKGKYNKIVTVKNGKNYNMGFGFRRLSIIDLSSKGHQPMNYNNYWIIFNGEIFNYKEIKNELLTIGYKFKTHTDTEVILASYCEWGEKCVERFNGQWAFCIYDINRGILFCSRDRFGIIPFYYYSDNNNFIFASEIKALLEFPFVKKQPNEFLLFDFVLFGLKDHTEETMYVNIKQLRGGHNIVLNLKSNKFKIYKYYKLKYNPDFGKYNHTQALEYADDIRELLIDSVKIRLRADVPIGSCLSGGLDSSSIVVIINKLLKEGTINKDYIGNRQKTFTASYKNSPIDESDYAREIIKQIKGKSCFTYPDSNTLWKNLDNIFYHQDEPFGSTSIYAQWEVIRAASKKVKVLLDGQGADEIFAGYPGYDSVFFSHVLKKCNIKVFINFIKSKILLQKDKEIGSLILKSITYLFSQDIKQKLFKISSNKKILNIVFKRNYINNRYNIIKNKFIPDLNKRLMYDETVYSLPQLLHFEDRNGMSFSVETRVPFIDHRLVDYLFQIPAVYKIHNGWRKWLLRMAMKDLLPEKILWRKDKIGFATPESKWLMSGNNKFKKFMKKKQIKKYTGFITWRAFLVNKFMEDYEKQ